jgi:microcystin-dependent protein
MTQPYIGELRPFSFVFAPRGWSLCNGQLLSIAQNQALFSILGTTYGGNGIQTFALPDLRGRSPLHWGVVGGYVLGESTGEETHTLVTAEIPLHLHQPLASSAAADQASPSGTLWANGGQAAYAAGTPSSLMHPAALGIGGGSQPHENRSPYLTVNYCIALQGLFPSRN